MPVLTEISAIWFPGFDVSSSFFWAFISACAVPSCGISYYSVISVLTRQLLVSFSLSSVYHLLVQNSVRSDRFWNATNLWWLSLARRTYPEWSYKDVNQPAQSIWFCLFWPLSPPYFFTLFWTLCFVYSRFAAGPTFVQFFPSATNLCEASPRQSRCAPCSWQQPFVSLLWPLAMYRPLKWMINR